MRAGALGAAAAFGSRSVARSGMVVSRVASVRVPFRIRRSTTPGSSGQLPRVANPCHERRRPWHGFSTRAHNVLRRTPLRLLAAGTSRRGVALARRGPGAGLVLAVEPFLPPAEGGLAVFVVGVVIVSQPLAGDL